MAQALANLVARIQERKDVERPGTYLLPALWTRNESASGPRIVEVDPVEFYLSRAQEILDGPDLRPSRNTSGGEWTKFAVVYNMFTRLTAAWDHDGNGEISIDDLPGGFRETGTFLKSIAILPFLQRLGVNALHLLPITMIGRDGNKGTLGSPYAIKNPNKLDPRLAEPWLDLGVDAECAAFVEAAHRLGIRVVTEFVFRTASKDADWIIEHPNWFYWIDAAVPDRDGTPAKAHGYGNPQFTADELKTIQLRVRKNDTASLPPPSMNYRSMFTEPPETVDVVDGKIVGTLSDSRKVRIPGAFADWPPDDVQPPWNDVTYLKMYDHSTFNYIAYNTIRIYDQRLATTDNENRGLWNSIINIIPNFQRNFDIDGVMIDMGHALPKRLKQSMVDRARKIDPDFAFWEENFAIAAKSRQEGYNAAVGYLWSDEHIPAKLADFIQLLAIKDTPVPFFATPESHDTPRAASREGGIVFSRMAMVVNGFLPAVLWIHQGYELGETYPVNTGLGFTQEDQARYPSHTLPLFSHGRLCWDSPDEFSGLISKIVSLRKAWERVVVDPREQTFMRIRTTNPMAIGYVRVSMDGKHAIAVLANMNCLKKTDTKFEIPYRASTLRDELSGRNFRPKDSTGSVTMEPGQAFVFQLTVAPS